MIYKQSILAFLFLAFSAIGLVAETTQKKLFRAGAATSNITPELGHPIVGNFTQPLAEHVHDELHARCLVLDDGERTIAFVVCDLLGVARNLTIAAQKMIQEELGIPAENVMISAVHSHSATSAMEYTRYELDEELSEYQKFVARRIADGVKRAHNLLRPAEFAYGYVDASEHVFNRRWFLKEGTMPKNPFGKTDEKVRMNPGPIGSPNLIEPAGPVDPRVSFIALREPGGNFISLLSAYSLHYVGGVEKSDISADYFGYYCRAIEKAFTKDEQYPPVVALMANGTSGDINNINFRKARAKKAPYEQMQYVANDVADKVIKTVEAGLEWQSDVSIDARARELDIKWREIPEELITWAKETQKIDESGENVSIYSRSYAGRVLNLAAMDGETKFPVHAFRIGDVCIGTAAAEMFAEIGLEFREKCSFKKSFMIELVGGYYGYIPTPRHFELGGYETWPGTNNLEPQASVKIIGALTEMADEMKK